MKRIKRAYYYFFYKLCKAAQYTSYPFGDFLIDFRAVVVIAILEVLLMLSCLNYYNIFIDKNFEPNNVINILIGTIIFVTNYFAFVHTDEWKEYNKEFDQLSKKVNTKGSWIVLGVVLLIIGNLIFSFYLMSQIDWSQYR